MTTNGRQDETSWGEGEASEAPAPRPVVVVQVRRSRLAMLATPLLVVFAAIVAFSLRLKVEDWRGLASYLPRAESERPPDPVEPPVAPIDSPRVLAVPAPVLAGPTAAERASRPPEPPRPSVPLPMPLAGIPHPIRSVSAEAEAARAWEEIRRQTEKAQDEAIAMEAVKAREGAEVERLAPQPVARDADDPAPLPPTPTSEETRLAFRDDLRHVVSGPPALAMKGIVELCERHGVILETDLRRLSASSKASYTATGRRERVARLRKMGTSEAVILQELIQLESRNRIARTGPKTAAEAYVRAARELIAVPVRPPVARRETR